MDSEVQSLSLAMALLLLSIGVYPVPAPLPPEEPGDVTARRRMDGPMHANL